MNILLADDSKLIRETLSRMISPYTNDAKIYFAADVNEAINCINQFQIDIAILDIGMPGGSGFDVLTEAKKKKQAPVVIMFSNYATDSYRNRALKDGADYFFDKSSDYEHLIQVLKDQENNLK